MLALRIALRYLLSRKSHNVVNVISAISVAGVAVAAAAIVIVLSVFNGFTSLADSRMSILEPDLKVVPAQGKVIAGADTLARQLETLECVAAAAPTLQERALLVAGHSQMPVKMRGVTRDFALVADVDSAVIDGAYMLQTMGMPGAQLSVGVAMKSGLRPGPSQRLTLNVPRREGRINPANPSAAFRQEELLATSVVSARQDEFDAEGVLVPLQVARQMLDYSDGEATSIFVRLDPDADPARAAAMVEAAHPGVKALTRLQQLAHAMRMISVEKWVTFMLLGFILVIASFNIISTLSLLVIEKRDNMATLRALGAEESLQSRVFIIEGWLITAIGGIAGIVLGAALALAQQAGGFITLSGDPATLAITAYPVRVEVGDLAAVLALVLAVGFAVSQTTRIFAK